MGNNRISIKEYNKALEMDPNYISARMERAKMCMLFTGSRTPRQFMQSANESLAKHTRTICKMNWSTLGGWQSIQLRVLVWELLTI
jgi:hypothetical protein